MTTSNLLPLDTVVKLNMYKLGNSSLPRASNKFIGMVANAEDERKLWHFCFGNTNYGSSRQMSHRYLTEGLPQINPPSGVFEGYVMGKHHQVSFQKDNSRGASRV